MPSNKAASSLPNVHSGRATMHLPAELRDLVVDHLQDDVAALHACSLIARAWLPRCRYHIFRRVQIEPGRRGHAFRALLDDNPELGKYVQDVEIFGSGQDLPIEQRMRIEWPTLRPGPVERSAEASPTSWLENTLPTSAKVLRRVSCLRLMALHIHTGLVDVLQRSFPVVRTLTLDKCRSAAFKDFCELACAMTCLEHLRVTEAHWLRPTLPPPVPPSPRTRFKTLVLSEKIEIAVALNWIVSQQLHTDLSSLSCYISGNQSATAIRDLLKAVGPTLQHLAIGFADVKDPTVTLQAAELSLSPCTSLRSLHIYCVNSQRFSSVPSLSWIIILLSKLNSSQLSDLKFSIAAADVPGLNLEGLAVILSHGRHAALKHLTFNIQARTDAIPCVEERIKARIASLTAKGVEAKIVCNQRGPSFA